MDVNMHLNGLFTVVYVDNGRGNVMNELILFNEENGENFRLLRFLVIVSE